MNARLECPAAEDSSAAGTNTDPMDPPTETAPDPDEPPALEYGEHGRCTAFARSADRRCRRPAVGPHGKCDKHGGASTGPRDPSALAGNDHAEGNPGGGAPPGNMNAWKHGAFGALENLDERLAGAARAFVDELTEAVVATAAENALELDPDRRRELAREYALLSYQWDLATVDSFERGVGYEVERTLETAAGEMVTYTKPVVNPTVKRSRMISAKKRELADELNLYGPPD